MDIRVIMIIVFISAICFTLVMLAILHIKNLSYSKVKVIRRKGRDLYIREMKVSELDVKRCSPKFLSHNFNDNKVVNVKCLKNGEIDFRGKRCEYRIIVPDKK